VIRTEMIVLALALAAPASAQDLAGLAKVPAAEPLTLAARAPGRWIARAVEEARAILPPEAGAAIDRALAEVAEEIEFQPADPDGWRAVGIDPDGVISFSLSLPGGWLGFPRRLRTVLPIADTGRLAAFLAAGPGEGEIEPDAGGEGIGHEFAFRPVGRQMILVGREDGEDVELMTEELRAAVDLLGGSETLASTAVYRAVAARIGGEAIAGLFLAPPLWRGEDAEPAAEPPAVESFLIAAADRTIAAALRLRADAPIAALLAPGDGDPYPALRRLPPPAASLTVRAADPAGLYAALTAIDSDFDLVPEELGALLAELGPALRGGALGLALYPDPEGAAPRFAAFATLGDEAEARARLSTWVEAVSPGTEALPGPAGSRLWQLDGGAAAVGLSDGALFLGTAAPEILATVRGSGEGHEPALRGDALIEFDLDLRETLGPIAGIAPRALSAGRLTGRVEVDDGLLTGIVQRVGREVGSSWLTEAFAWAALAEVWETQQVDKTDRARADLATIHAAALVFTVRNGRVPTWSELIEPDATGNPYLEGGRIPDDPWGRPYAIRALPGRLRFEIVSSGPDGVAGSADDLAHPKRD
jgi:general secretion pathway protein G